MEPTSDQLIAVLCVYNEAALLPACLDSLVGKVDRMVLADGRYQMFPGDNDASDDGTLDIAREYGCEVIEAPAGGWPTEHEKRTALIRAGELGDMYLVIDADERLMNGQNLRHRYGDFRLQIIGVNGTPGRQDAVRLFAHRPGMTYHWHFHITTPAGVHVLRKRDTLAKDAAWIAHHHAERDPERVKADKEYEARLVPFEKELGAYGGR